MWSTWHSVSATVLVQRTHFSPSRSHISRLLTCHSSLGSRLLGILVSVHPERDNFPDTPAVPKSLKPPGIMNYSFHLFIPEDGVVPFDREFGIPAP